MQTEMNSLQLNNVRFDMDRPAADLARGLLEHLESRSEESEGLQELPAIDFSEVFGELSLVERQLILPARTVPRSLADSLFSIISSSNFRRGSLELINPYRARYEGYFNWRIAEGLPLEFTLLSFPFKDQNPLSTRINISNVDLGEVNFLNLLGSVCQSVGAVYEPGMQINLISDGRAYQSMFLDKSDDTSRQVSGYYSNLEAAISLLGLGRQLRLFDLAEITDRVSGFKQRTVELTEQIISSTSVETHAQLAELTRGVMYNCPYLFGTEREFLQLAARESLLSMPSEHLDEYRRRAANYAAYGLALAEIDVISRSFPNSLRLTVHPKEAFQLPVHTGWNGRNMVAPYNGVPVVDLEALARRGSLLRATRVMRYAQAVQLPGLRAVNCSWPDGRAERFCLVFGKI